MNQVQLRAFHAVATEGSFTKAARALRVTQPTISSQVKALEEAYGVRLFDRRGREVITTPLGRALLAVTGRMFSLEEEAAEMLTSARALQSGQIKVGADGPYHVIPILAEFSRRHPGIEIALTIGNSDKVLRDLLDYRTDVAVLAKLREDPRLHVLPYRRDRLVVLVPQGHVLAHRGRIRIGELAEERLVLREPGSVTREIFEAALQRGGITPKAVIEIESREAAREAVAAGLGVGAIFATEFGGDSRMVALDVTDAALEVGEYVLCLDDRRRLRVVRAFLDSAREVAAKL